MKSGKTIVDCCGECQDMDRIDVLIVQLAEKSYAALDPVSLGFLCVQKHRQDVVGGMSSRRKRSPSLRRFVNWTLVTFTFVNVILFTWDKPYDRHQIPKDFRLHFSQMIPKRTTEGSNWYLNICAYKKIHTPVSTYICRSQRAPSKYNPCT